MPVSAYSGRMTGISILTYNLQNGQIWDDRDPDNSPVDLDQVISVMRDIDADIMFLQEVEYPAEPFPDTSQHPNYDRIRRAFPGHRSFFAYPQTEYGQIPFGIGLAILSRYPLEDMQHVVLPAADIEFDYAGRTWHAADRSLLKARILLDGRPVTLLNTHLQAYFMIDSSSDDHPLQRDMLVKEIQSARELGDAVLLGGDFNCAPEENTLKVIQGSGLTPVQTDKITWRRRPYVLDHIFYSPHFRLSDFRLVHSDASDHYPLVAHMEQLPG